MNESDERSIFKPFSKKESNDINSFLLKMYNKF